MGNEGFIFGGERDDRAGGGVCWTDKRGGDAGKTGAAEGGGGGGMGGIGEEKIDR